MSVEWWGTFTIPVGQERLFRIGPLILIVQRLPHEWQVIRHDAPDGLETELAVDEPRRSEEPPPRSQVTRFATGSDGTDVRIVPILPDRTVITRPERPLTLLPNTTVTLYVGSPAWVRLLEDGSEPIGEVPISPPKLAWLGPNTTEGELCYATRTVGRLSLSDSTLRHHRVMTPVAIHNEASTPFVCEQVNLPVRRLAVYASPNGRLFTEAMTLVRAHSDEFARVEVTHGAPPQAPGGKALSAARDVESESAFRAFGRLFG